MPKAKTTVVIDRRLLDAFRTLAAARHGGARSLSSELEEAIRAFSPVEVIGSVAGRLGLTITRYPSLDEVARTRPTVSVSAGEVVREMRDERERRISGHE